MGFVFYLARLFRVFSMPLCQVRYQGDQRKKFDEFEVQEFRSCPRASNPAESGERR